MPIARYEYGANSMRRGICLTAGGSPSWWRWGFHLRTVYIDWNGTRGTCEIVRHRLVLPEYHWGQCASVCSIATSHWRYLPSTRQCTVSSLPNCIWMIGWTLHGRQLAWMQSKVIFETLALLLQIFVNCGRLFRGRGPVCIPNDFSALSSPCCEELSTRLDQKVVSHDTS